MAEFVHVIGSCMSLAGKGAVVWASGGKSLRESVVGGGKCKLRRDGIRNALEQLQPLAWAAHDRYQRTCTHDHAVPYVLLCALPCVYVCVCMCVCVCHACVHVLCVRVFWGRECAYESTRHVFLHTRHVHACTAKRQRDKHTCTRTCTRPNHVQAWRAPLRGIAICQTLSSSGPRRAYWA